MVQQKNIEVVEFEEHSSVLPEWLGRGFQHRTLIYLDAHLDLQQISESRLGLLKACQGQSDAVRFEKPHFLCPDSGYSFSIEDFLFAAGSLEIVDRVIWVLPPHVKLGYSAEVLLALQQSAGVTLEDLMSFTRSPEGWLAGRLLGLEITLCNLHQLDRIPVPENALVDIDIDFFLTGTNDQLWIHPSVVYEKINSLELELALVTISRSVQSGFMPLKYRFVAAYLASLFRGDTAELNCMESLLDDDATVIRYACQERQSADAYYHRSLHSSDETQAKQLLQKAIDLDPIYRPSVLRNIGRALNVADALPLADLSASLDQSKDLSDEDRALAHAGLGVLHCRNGDVASALVEYSSVAEYFGSHPALALEIGRLFFQSGDHPRAERFLGVATSDDKTRVIATVLLAQLTANRGSFEKAIELLSPAVCSAPAWTDAQELLATLYQRVANHGKASEILQECRRQQHLLATLSTRLNQSDSPPAVGRHR